MGLSRRSYCASAASPRTRAADRQAGFIGPHRVKATKPKQTHRGGIHEDAAQQFPNDDGAIQPDWTNNQTGGSPTAVYGDVFVHDPADGYNLEFGGETASGTLSNATYDYCCTTSTWNSITTPSGLTPRVYSQAAYDPATAQVVLFGGEGSTSVLGDTWVFTAGAWQSESPSNNPPKRYAASMAWDPAMGEVVMYGGYGTSGSLNDMWGWTGSNWVQITQNGTVPNPRWASGLAFDPNLPATSSNPSGQLVMFGGTACPSASQCTTSTGAPDNTTDVFTATSSTAGTWSAAPLSGSTPPSARRGFSLAYDGNSGSVVLFGGLTSSTYMNDTWRYDGTQWTQMQGIASPSGRAFAPMAYGSENNWQSAQIFGGVNANGVVTNLSGGGGTLWEYTHKTASVSLTPVTNNPYVLGSTVTYNLLIGNVNTVKPINATDQVITLPSGVVDPSVNSGACNGTSTPSCTSVGANTVSISDVELPPGGSQSFTVTGIMNASGLGATLNCPLTGGTLPNGGSLYATQIEASNPTVYYRLDGSGTTAVNSGSGSGLNGTFTGSVGSGPGALMGDTDLGESFTGGYLTANQQVPSSSALTVEAWVDPAVGQNANYSPIIDMASSATSSSETNQFTLSRAGTGDDLEVVAKEGSGTTQALTFPNGLQPGVWQQIAASITANGVITLYRDGEPLAQLPAASQPPAFTAIARSLEIGASLTGSLPSFQGGIDEVAVYPSALPATTIAADYQDGTLTGAGASSASVTTPEGNVYANQILGLAPSGYWRLGDPTTGTTRAYDQVTGTNDAPISSSGVSFGQQGALAGDADTAASFNGSSGDIVLPGNAIPTTQSGSLDVWFKTSSSTGGVLLGSANTAAGTPAQFQPDLYVSPSGYLYGGLYDGGTTNLEVTSQAVNNGSWYHAILTTSSGGQTLTLANAGGVISTVTSSSEKSTGTSNLSTTELGTGYVTSTWPGWTGTSAGYKYFNGTIDEVAITPTIETAPNVATTDNSAAGALTYGQSTAVASYVGSNGVLQYPLSVCDSDLGIEPWWTYVNKPLGTDNSASVNVANGNLVVQADDSTPIPAQGHLDFAVHRTYNSQDNGAVALPTGLNMGVGWELNLGQTDDVLGDAVGAAGLDVPDVVDQLADPLGVTLIDRDGTRHVFTANVLGTALSATGALAPPTGDPLTMSNLCVDTTFTAPPGVHLSLWRYVQVSSGGCSAQNIAAQGTVVGYVAERPDRLRYEFSATGEPLSITDQAGNQLDFAYDTAAPAAGALGRLRLLYEPNSNCQVNRTGGIVTYGLTSGTGACNALTFGYNDDSTSPCPVPSISGAVASTCMTDPAGRVTTYAFDGGYSTDRHLLAVINPDGSTVRYAYGSSCSANTPGSMPSANDLCGVTDARGNTTYFYYANPTGSAVDNQQILVGITDRRGYGTRLAYNSAGSTTVDESADTTSPTGSGFCPAASTSCERQDYTNIDSVGRVADESDGTPANDDSNAPTYDQWLHTIRYYWDQSGNPCSSSGTVDNDLCSYVELRNEYDAQGDSEAVEYGYTYNPVGQVTSDDHLVSIGDEVDVDDITTDGYRLQYLTAASGGTAVECTDEVVTGDGQVNTNSTTHPTPTTGCGSFGVPSPTSVVSVISDPTEQLSPDGNTYSQQGAFTPWLTTYYSDDNAADPANAVPSTNPCAFTNLSSPTSNTGLVCETAAPADADAGLASTSTCLTPTPAPTADACTRDIYNTTGNVTISQTPQLTANYPSKGYFYFYSPTTAEDASCRTSAAGWLWGVQDPDGTGLTPATVTKNFVAFTYDAAGDNFRTWDRDATTAAGKALSTYASTCTNGSYAPDNGVSGYTETDYGPYTGGPKNGVTDSGNNKNLTAQSAPWRWVTSTRDQIGNWTDYCYDPNGNLLLTRPPRGAAGSTLSASACATLTAPGATPGPYDTINFSDTGSNSSLPGWNQNDQPTTVIAPVEGAAASYAASSGTQTAYDAFGNVSSVTDPDGNVTAYTYDAVNRPTLKQWTRESYATAVNPTADCYPGTQTTSANAPLPNGRVLCQSSEAYDGADDLISSTNARDETSTFNYDDNQELTQAIVPGTAYKPGGTSPAAMQLETDTVYDNDGNVIRECDPRDYVEGGVASGNCPNNPIYGTTTTYDSADLPTGVLTYRAPPNSSESTSSAQPILACTYYNAMGQPLDTQNPNAYATPPSTTSCGANPNASNSTRYTYDERDDLVTKAVTGGAGTDTTTYGYDPSQILSTVMTPNGNTTAYTYDVDHRPTDTVVAETASNPVPVATGGANVQTMTRYDADGNVIERWSPDAFAASGTTPDADHMTAIVYDNDDRPVKQYVPRYDGANGVGDVGSGGSDTQGLQCPTGINLPSTASGIPSSESYAAYSSTAGVCLTAVSYNGDSEITRQIDPTGDGSTANNQYDTMTYTDDGSLASTVSPNPNSPATGQVTTSYRYDGDGNLLDTTAPAINGDTGSAHTDTTTSYTLNDLPATTTGPSETGGPSHVVNYTYDAAGNPLSEQVPSSNSSTFSSSDDTYGQTITYYSDGLAADYTSGSTDMAASQDTTHYTYDLNGNPTAVFSPNAYATLTSSGSNSAAISALDGYSFSTGGSAMLPGSNLSGSNTQATLTTYNPDNTVATVSTPVNASGSTERTISYTYDGDANKVSAATQTGGNSGGTQSWTYYADDRLDTRVGRADSNGNRITVTDTYDPDGNLTKAADGTPADEVDATYYLDNLARTVNDNATIGAGATKADTDNFAYDAAGDQTVRQITGADPQSTTDSYNAADLPSNQTSTVGSSSLTWSWMYDQRGDPTSQTYTSGSNSQTQTDTWNDDGTLSTQSLGTSGAVAQWTYSYDSLDRITSQQNTGTSAGTGTAATGTYNYSYSKENQLNAFNAAVPGGSGAVTSTITFDHDGNRTGDGPNASIGSCTPTAASANAPATLCAQYNADDSISQASDSGGHMRTYTYDNAGRLTGDGCSTYSDDGLDRTHIISPSGGTGCTNTSTGTYSYDALDRQNTNATGSATTAVHYDGLGSAIDAEATSKGATTYQLDPSDDPIAAETGSVNELLYTDGNGNITTITQQGSPTTVDCTARFDPFGTPERASNAPDPTCATGTATTDLFYDSGRRDQSSGTYQDGARTYNPATSAFTTPDTPTGTGAAANPAVGADPLTADTYTYVNGDPLNATDPDGHIACSTDEGQDFCGSNPGHRIVERNDAEYEAVQADDENQSSSNYYADYYCHIDDCSSQEHNEIVDSLYNADNRSNVVQAEIDGYRTAAKQLEADEPQHHWWQTAVSIAASVATFVGCDTVSLGVGTVGCAVLAGAVGGAVNGAFSCQGSVSCIAKNTAIGGVSGLVGAGLGAGLSSLTSAVSSRLLSGATDEIVTAAEDSGPAVRSFAHGTSPGSASDIASNGLDETAARAESGGGLFSTPGGFHTLEIDPENPSDALDKAFGYGLLKSATPNVVVSELPEDVFQNMLDQGLASVEKVPGLGEQTVFQPGGFDTFNQFSTRYVINPYE